MHGEAVHHRAVQAPPRGQVLPDRHDGERPVRAVRDDGGVQRLEADVDVGGQGIGGIGVGQPALGVAVEALGPLEAVAAFAGRQQHGDVHLRGVEGVGQGLERGDLALDPGGVDVGHKDRIGPQQGQGVGDAAAGIQQAGALVGDQDLGAAPAGRQVRLNLVGEVVDVDDRAGHPRRRQAVEHVVDQGAAGHLDQGLGPVVGQGPHAGAEAGGQDHGGGDLRHGRAPAGTWRSNQPFSPSMPGAARSRSR